MQDAAQYYISLHIIVSKHMQVLITTLSMAKSVV